MKKVLILSYYWPPGSGPGVQRWLKFTKYLSQYGWIPTVITVRNGSYPARDESLLEDVNADVKVIRTNTLEPFKVYNFLRGKKGDAVELAMGSLKGNSSALSRLANYIRSNVFIPDARIGWNRYSIPAALRELNANKYDALITTGPPHSTHLAGMTLATRTSVPWLADFRDPWTSVYYNELLSQSEKTKKRDLALESAVLSKADHVLTATPGLESEFSERTKKISTIYNGYDPEDIPESISKKHTKFTLAYVGNIKANQNFDSFWQALSALNQNETFSSQFQLQITGNVHPSFVQSAHQLNLDHLIEYLDFVPHAQAVQRMFDAHMLYLPIPRNKNSQRIMTGKIFEYLATQRPLLAIGPVEGNVAQTLFRCEKESVIDYGDCAAIISHLERHLMKFQANPEPTSSGNEKYKEFSRSGCTKQLAQLLDQISMS